MKDILKWFVVIFFASCSTLNKDSQLLRHSASEIVSETFSEKSVFNTLVLSSDSLYAQVEVVLSPKGAFSFSLSEGFRGEASRVTIKKKETSNKKNSIIAQAMRATDQNRQIAKVDTDLLRTKAKQRFAFNWMPWVLIIGAMALTYFLWAKRKKLFLSC